MSSAGVHGVPSVSQGGWETGFVGPPDVGHAHWDGEWTRDGARGWDLGDRLLCRLVRSVARLDVLQVVRHLPLQGAAPAVLGVESE